jgi:hypothetical protein
MSSERRFSTLVQASPKDEGSPWFVCAFGFTFAVLTLLTGFALVRFSEEPSQSAPVTEREAEQLARTGLNAALSWFRQQSAQPVAALTPSAQDSADPSRHRAA